MTSSIFGPRRLAVAAILAAAIAAPASAQAPIAFQNGDKLVGKAFQINKIVAVPAYSLTFITAQQATAASSIEARARLTSVLAGVEPVMMRRLANEAHADLKTKLAAAGVQVASDDVARSAAVGMETLPGNMDIKPIGASVTIGKGVQLAWATFGADAAPTLKAYHNPSANPGQQLAIIGANRTLAQGSRRIASALLMPALTFDFVDSSAGTGLRIASVGAKTTFALRNQTTQTTLVSTLPTGPAVGFGGALLMGKDVVNATPFATVQTGDAAVRALSTGATDGLGNRNTRGDAVVVDPAVWEGLVRQTFRAYNDALVATVVRTRG